jgi:hypothetical protein
MLPLGCKAVPVSGAAGLTKTAKLATNAATLTAAKDLA